MEKLNITAKPRAFTEDGTAVKEEDYYLAPCMLQEATPKEIILPISDPEMESTSVICFVSTGKFLPPPVFHRLLGACLAQWPIAKQKSINLNYCGCCVFNLDPLHRLTLYFKGYVVFVQITRMKIADMKLSSNLCSEARKFIFENLSMIIGNLGQSCQFEPHVRCPESEVDSLEGLIAVSLLQRYEKVRCHAHDRSHTLASRELLKFWYKDEEHSVAGSSDVHVLTPPAGDTDRFIRLTYLLVDVGSRILRQLLSHHTVTPTCTLDQYLANNRSTLVSLLKRKVLHQPQMDILFPPNGGNTNLEDYDVTLLSTLFNNVVPSLTQQEEGMIKSLREDRNKLHGHAKSCKMNATEYQTCWASISSTLITLSQQCRDANFQNEISQEIQRIQVSAVPTGSYLDILKTWFSTIETVKGSLETTEGELRALKARVEALEMKKTAKESEGQ